MRNICTTKHKSYGGNTPLYFLARTHCFAEQKVSKETGAAITDLELNQVIDSDLVKIMSWYDNERGYANW